MTPTQKQALEAALSALESERIMAADAQGNYTVEVTPKRIIDAIEKVKATLAEPEQEPSYPHIVEKISYHSCERNDMTLKDCLSFLETHGWHRVRGRTEREMVLQITFLLASVPQPRDHEKLWLWKNFVDGRSEYWAFDNAYPIHIDNDDPQVLGEPCGYALYKPSRNSGVDRREPTPVAPQPREWQELSEDDVLDIVLALKPSFASMFALTAYKAISAALRAKNGG